MNGLTDMDWGWWPVLFLRPTKDKDIDTVLLLKLSIIFGSIIGLFYLFYFYLVLGELPVDILIGSFFIGWLLFFILYKVTFVFFWNRRARRLRGK